MGRGKEGEDQWMDLLPVMMVEDNMDRIERHVSDLERGSDDSSREEGSGQGSMQVQLHVDLKVPVPAHSGTAIVVESSK
ncbi:hypothetical protein MA16_Dca014831 [Dendrobium catenatum]|uniref:Uncharacterized protein n=1 Tax=Dendrobium catenatum TaxID=906689 RepID=A0A2I0XB74_9ASPA|nr:hypothetical protein MA16_Dca014831 [Dendrobium catenatum]